MFLISVLFSLDKDTEVELPGCMVLLLIFEAAPYRFPQRLHQFAFPLAVPEGSLFSTSSPVTLPRVVLTGVRGAFISRLFRNVFSFTKALVNVQYNFVSYFCLLAILSTVPDATQSS